MKQQAERQTLRTPVSYRVRNATGTLVLCRDHLELFRLVSASAVKLTGETFEAALCDHCNPQDT